MPRPPLTPAQALTRGSGRKRAPQDPTLKNLQTFTLDPNPDLVAFRALIDEVGSPDRFVTGRVFDAWMYARNRYAELTGDVPPGPSSPYLRYLKPAEDQGSAQ